MFKKQLLSIAFLFSTLTQLEGKVIEVKSHNFDSIVKQSKLPVVVDAYATWCGPCQRMKPVFEELSKEFENKVIFVKFDVDANRTLATQLGVTMFPTFFMFENGTKKHTIVGGRSKDILKSEIQSTFSIK